MRWLSAALVLLLLIASPLAGLEITETYVESYLDSLPYRLIYWTQKEEIRIHVPPTFSTVRVVQEDGTTGYAVYVTELAAPARPGKLSYGDFLTQYFYFIPYPDEPSEMYGPSGQEIFFVATQKPIVPYEEAIQEMQSTIAEFASLTSAYRSYQRDDSGGQFWSFLGLSIVMGGLTTLGVYGVATLEGGDVLYAGAAAVCCGFLTVSSVALTVANLRDYRSRSNSLREIEARLKELQPIQQ
jgi:hypothetical protein